MQHLLVPVDFSEPADTALTYAMALAGKLGARLTLVHVIHLAPLGVAEGGTVLPYLEAIEAQAQEGMEEYRAKVQAAELNVDVVITHGVPFQSIIEVAKERQVDLIVMGTHGRTGVSHVLLGSVAERVVRLAPCPVLIAR